MANIELLGNTYNDVPAVSLPKSGGGNALFYENVGSSMELIWTNSNPTAQFAAQTLNFSGSYDAYVITFRVSTEYGVSQTTILPIGITENIGSNNGSNSYYRQATTAANYITFGTGNSNDNKRVIPYFIFGIKESAV